MFVPSAQGADASTAFAALTQSGNGHTPPSPEQIRHILIGTLSSIQTTISQLYQCGYAEPNDWSRILPTGRPNEAMVILTKRTRPPVTHPTAAPLIS